MKAEINLQIKKLELIQWLSTIEDSSVLNKIIEIKLQESKDWWDLVSDTEKKAIDNGIEDAENGKLNTHATARKLYEKWL